VGVDLKYQPDQKGNDLFGVDVQTHMFNNRVVVNGSVGNKQYSEKAQTDVVGDLDIEIKLNQSGAFRLNLFSHSADSYTNYLDNSQRNGVGLTYQTEFSSLSQFIKNIFMNKDKRQEARLSEENAKADVEKVTIQIE
jgi:flavorubredoxin